MAEYFATADCPRAGRFDWRDSNEVPEVRRPLAVLDSSFKLDDKCRKCGTMLSDSSADSGA